VGKKNDSGATGILLIDKDQGISSHGVVSRVRKWLGTRKVGHAGTLDPMATGLLVLGAGKGTKLLTYLVGCDKTYLATIRLGASTPTDDADSPADTFADPSVIGSLAGELQHGAAEGSSAAVPGPGPGVARIEAALAPLRGDIEQVPSAVSAIKVDGVRSYARVRAGEDVELKARPVTVSRFEVLAEPRVAVEDGRTYIDIDVVVDCSSGTYIRALARDLGRALGVYGHLTALRRTRVGAFTVEQAQPAPDFAALADGSGGVPTARLKPLALVAASVLPVITVDEAEALALAQGKFVPVTVPAGIGPQHRISVLTGDRLVAVAHLDRGRLAVDTGFLTPADLGH
jgi:tRNA pseudouridine55 synthase